MSRVLIAARSAITQAGLAALLADGVADGVMTLVGLSTPDSWMAQIEALHPDVVLIEPEEGDELGTRLQSIAGSVPAIVALIDTPSNGVADLLQAGVQGVLPKETIAGELIAAIAAVAAGLVVVHPTLLSGALALPSVYANPVLDLQRLTPREVEVLGMLAEGLGNKTIAQRLTISEHTVKFHISSIFSKLQVTSRTEAVILGARLGLILL